MLLSTSPVIPVSLFYSGRCVDSVSFQQMLRTILLALKGILAGTIKGITITFLNRSDIEDLNGTAGSNH